MKFFGILILFILIQQNIFSQQPAFEWASQCGNPPNTTDTKTVLAPASEGQFYLAGEFLDTTQFGQKMLISSGGTDIFLVKNMEDGTPAWANRIGGGDYDYVQKVIVDADGNVIVAGYFYGGTLIGPDHYTSYGSQDIFIAKYNAEGNFLWSYRAGGQSADYIMGLALDGYQNIVITGYFYDEMYFGETTLTASSSSDIYLAKFNPGGDLLWTVSAGGSSSDQSRSASCDPEGNILISGSFYYDVTLGDTTLSTINPVGVFIARYLPDGQLDCAFQLDGTYLSTENYVVSAHDGSFYLSGNFSEMIQFGNTVYDAGEFNQDIYVAKYDASCDLKWARHAYSPASDQVMGIDVDPDDNLYLTGHYLDTISFEPVVLPYTLCCGSREIFIVKYSATGDVLWGRQISGARASVQSLAMDPQGNLLLSGLFTEDLILGDLTLSNFEGFQNYIASLQTGIFTFIPQPDAKSALKVFPNPSRDAVQIIFPFESGLFNYRIYNESGSLLAAGRVGPGEYIDICILPSGLYILRFNDPGTGISHTCRFIKNN